MTSTDGDDLDVTVVVPVWNNAATLVELTEGLLSELSSSGRSHEVVLVDDASDDDSWERIVELSSSYNAVRGVGLAGNVGAGTARAAGCSVARGRWICMIDGDLDYDPHDVLAVIDLLAEGNDFVSGVRVDDQGRPVLRRAGSWVLHRTVRRVWSFSPNDIGCGVQGWTSELARRGLPHLSTHRDMAWAVPLLRPVRRYAEVPVRERSAGRPSSYGNLRLARRLWGLARAVHPWVPSARVCVAVAAAMVSGAAYVASPVRRSHRVAVASVSAAWVVYVIVTRRGARQKPPFRITRRAGRSNSCQPNAGPSIV
jgi:GT2 family glycosyltransferase